MPGQCPRTRNSQSGPCTRRARRPAPFCGRSADAERALSLPVQAAPGSPSISTLPPHRTLPTGSPWVDRAALGMEAESGSSRHEVKRQISNKRPKSPPKGNKQNLHRRRLPLRRVTVLCKPSRALAVRAGPAGTLGRPRALGRVLPGPMYVHACQRAVLSDSSSGSLFPVSERRRTCSRGLRRSVDPSSTWMEGTSKWTRSGRWQRER